VAIMTYHKWIWWNLADVLIFVGISVCAFYLVGWVRRSRAVGWRVAAGGWSAADHFHLAFLAMMLVLNFSGVTLGEVGRLWLQFMPFVAILAAAELAERSGARLWLTSVVMALQMAMAIVLKLRMSWL